jgi:hypothetical protein
MTINRRFSGLYLARCPRFNLNKTKDVPIPSDKVDLSVAARGTEVSCHDHVTQLAQVKTSLFLALGAGLLALRSGVRWQITSG